MLKWICPVVVVSITTAAAGKEAITILNRAHRIFSPDSKA
jgi:hypothetical protein